MIYGAIAAWSVFSIIVGIKTWRGLNKIDNILRDWERER